MKKKTEPFKLDATGIRKKITATVKKHLQNASKLEIRIRTEDYFPTEAFDTIKAMNDTIALLDKIVEEIKKMPKAYLVKTESRVFLFPIPDSSRNIQKSWTSEIIILPAPCKEWKTLSEKLHKYTGKMLPVEACRTERLWGKRDIVEVTSTCHMALSPETCKNVIRFLGKRGSKDTVEFRIKNELDEADRYNGDGEDRESEYYATRYYYLQVTIKTPTGRFKTGDSFYV